MDTLSSLFSLIFFIALIAVIFFLVKMFKGRKDKETTPYKTNKKRMLISLAVLAISFVAVALTTSESDTTDSSSQKTEQSSSSKKESSDDDSEDSDTEESEEDEEVSDPNNYEQIPSYDDLARNNGNYTSKLIKFSGTVFQTSEDKGNYVLLVAVNDDPDALVMVYVPKEQAPTSNILEDDNIEIMGRSIGMKKYETTSGAENRIPSVYTTYKVNDQGQ